MIAVLGASGQVGRAVCQALLADGHTVRAIGRDVQRLPAGAMAHELADWSPAALQDALADADAAFVMVPLVPEAVELGRISHAAAQAAGVSRVVRLSVLSGLIDAETRLGRLHGTLDADLAERGLDHVILRPDGFMQNLLAEAPALRAGTLTNATGDGAMGLIDVADIAACAAAWLTTDDPLPGQPMDLTGPELLSHSDVAARYAQWSGQPVRYEDISPGTLADVLRGVGLPEFLVQTLAEIAAWSRDPSQPRGLTPAVADRLGRPARRLEAFFDAHAATFLSMDESA